MPKMTHRTRPAAKPSRATVARGQDRSARKRASNPALSGVGNNLAATYGPIADALAKLFYPQVEVVVHDLTTMTIAYIANAFSKRSVGDESLLDGDVEEICAAPVYGPYEKAHVNGNQLKSISVVLEGSAGRTGLLCINVDLTVFRSAKEALTEMLRIEAQSDQDAKALIARDWRETANFEIREYLQGKSKTLAALTKSERVELVARFDALGLFNIRGAADRLAGQLEMSRASFYRCLTDARKGRELPDGDDR
jgi:D-arginine utilization repressor